MNVMQVAFGVAGVVLFVAGTSMLVWAVYATRSRKRKFTKEQLQFRIRREWLEAYFLKIASESGSPRGMTWADCDFSNDVQFARDRASGELRAFVEMTVRFEVVEGCETEDFSKCGSLRVATAMFYYRDGKWASDGRTIFNLNPTEAIRRFHSELRTVK